MLVVFRILFNMWRRAFDTRRLHYFLTRPAKCVPNIVLSDGIIFVLCSLRTASFPPSRSFSWRFSLSFARIQLHTHTHTSLVFFHTAQQRQRVNQYKKIKRADTWVAARCVCVNSQHFSFHFFVRFWWCSIYIRSVNEIKPKKRRIKRQWNYRKDFRYSE